jgi:hypothetical protein
MTAWSYGVAPGARPSVRPDDPLFLLEKFVKVELDAAADATDRRAAIVLLKNTFVWRA